MVQPIEEKRNRVLEEQRHVSTKISDLCRYIGFGIAAASYSIFSSNSEFSIEILRCHSDKLLIVSILAILVILADYLQFLCGYISVRMALLNEADEYRYKLKSVWYQGRFVFFISKQVLSVLSVSLLLFVMAVTIS